LKLEGEDIYWII